MTTISAQCPGVTVTDWRDVADQVTPKQIAELIESEQSRLDASPTSPCRVNAVADLIALARQYADTNALQRKYAHIPHPHDAFTVDGWTDENGEVFRTFAGSSWRVPVTGGPGFIHTHHADIPVEIRGVQHADGKTDRRVAIGDMPEDLSPATARVLAESLTAAHAEIERLAR